MDDIEYRVLQFFRDARAATLPLRSLHGRLIAEGGAAASYARFADAIRRSRRLVVLEAGHVLGDAAEWPAGVRSEYEQELAAAGVDSGPLVALRPAAAAMALDAFAAAPDDAVVGLEPALDRIQDSLIEALDRAQEYESFRRAVTEALADCLELRPVLAPERIGPATSDPPRTPS